MPQKILDGDFTDLKEKVYLINDRTIRIEEHLKNLNGELIEVKQSEKECKVDFDTKVKDCNIAISNNTKDINSLRIDVLKVALLVGGGGLGGGVIGTIISKFIGL